MTDFKALRFTENQSYSNSGYDFLEPHLAQFLFLQGNPTALSERVAHSVSERIHGIGLGFDADMVWAQMFSCLPTDKHNHPTWHKDSNVFKNPDTREYQVLFSPTLTTVFCDASNQMHQDVNRMYANRADTDDIAAFVRTLNPTTERATPGFASLCAMGDEYSAIHSIPPTLDHRFFMYAYAVPKNSYQRASSRSSWDFMNSFIEGSASPTPESPMGRWRPAAKALV